MNAEHALQQLVLDLVRAWNSRDGTSFCGLFDEDADYVTGSGVRLAGRGSIRDALFADASGALDSEQVAVTTQSVKALGPDAAVILCTWQIDSAGRAGVMTIVTRRTGEAWRIIALQNTDKTP